MTPMTKEALAEHRQRLLQWQDIYSDPVDRENQSLFVFAEAVLDELEAKDKRNAELNSTLERWATDRAQSASEIDELQSRAESAEQALLPIGELKKRLEEQTGEKWVRSAELIVTLPPYSFFDFKIGSNFKSGAYCNVDALVKELAAAGITLQIQGGE